MSLPFRRSAPILAAGIVLVSVPSTGAGGASQNLTPVYHVVDGAGDVVSSQHAERAFNPASLVKVATTLWALEQLGPEHRFETRFGIRGHRDPAGAVVRGDLVVDGSGDPDFHVENAWLVAQALNAIGIREFTGSVVVDDDFWIGWEGGSEKRDPDPASRVRLMAQRLRDALDADRRNADNQRSIAAFVARRSWTPGTTASIEFQGAPPTAAGDATADGVAATAWLVTHRSNPLVLTLKRFNAFSNNDIERFETALGPPRALEAVVLRHLGPKAGPVRLSTLSGLDVNRLDALGVVGLLRELRRTCAEHGLTLGDVLPVVGCDPGTLRNFPGLGTPAFEGAVTAKTGSLDQTDGGVAVLAGVVATAAGERTFCIASTQVSGRLGAARAAQESWLLRLVAESGGPRPAPCPAGVPFSDEQAEVVRGVPGPIPAHTP